MNCASRVKPCSARSAALALSSTAFQLLGACEGRMVSEVPDRPAAKACGMPPAKAAPRPAAPLRARKCRRLKLLVISVFSSCCERPYSGRPLSLGGAQGDALDEEALRERVGE